VSGTEIGVLALDVGTSSCRATLYDALARPIVGRAARVTYSPRMTPDGGAELDPETLFGNVCASIDQVLRQGEWPRVKAVGVSTFWHSLLGLDCTGEPVTPVYLWLDGRARDYVARLRQKLDESAVHARTGCVLHYTYWPARLSWLRETAPAVFKRVKRWVSFGELLQQRLTGSTGVSLSMASGTGLLNIHACDWDWPLLEFLEIEPSQLGVLVALDEQASSTRWESLKGVPWLPAVGDGACSNLGAGCASPDRFALMIGTSGAERAVWSPSAEFQVPRGLWCYRVDRGRIITGGALNDGGSLLNWLRGSLKVPDPGAIESNVAGMEPDSHGLTVLPFWGGERNPGWADDARGAIVGLRLGTSPEAIVRACMEAVALRFAVLDRLLLQAAPEGREVIGTGGALLHSPAWMQIIADALGRPVLASAEAEASSRGAALLGLETVGALEKPIDQLLPATTSRYEPVGERTETYRRAAERQSRLYDALVG
jgi:gluconokinase